MCGGHDGVQCAACNDHKPQNLGGRVTTRCARPALAKFYINAMIVLHVYCMCTASLTGPPGPPVGRMRWGAEVHVQGVQ